ncbi:YpfB family protein [Neobacillus sp. OS1-32]|uniref:YpfB family protein n=1 Tax=Neobacillus sp. OS1-32 TaxID=3070682 RepID=UPI0027E1A878|nr:YpfB family protein [Neobacillus sp. OS1-32]WML30848.1 YpfB family protein [Neobacillus sp. OS1-32]
MERVEKFLFKLVIVQFLFLILTQIFFHQFNFLPEVKQLTKYEGVTKNTMTDILETIKGK